MLLCVMKSWRPLRPHFSDRNWAFGRISRPSRDRKAELLNVIRRVLGACVTGIALGKPRTRSRRALQRRASRGARAQPRRCPASQSQADQGSSADRPAHRQRSGATQGASHSRHDHRRWTRDHSGGGMADRQLSSRREANPPDPLRSAGRLLPAAAQTGRRAIRGLSPRLRRGLGLRRSYRQPFRSRRAVLATYALTRRSSR